MALGERRVAVLRHRLPQSMSTPVTGLGSRSSFTSEFQMWHICL